MISIRTKLALNEKKKRGATLGKPKNFSNSGRILGGKKRKEKAALNPNNIRAISLITRCRNEGMTFEKIANELNQNSFTTVRGKGFTKNTVRRLYKRV